ncbi:MAG: exosortase C-terminal domain/associated protein EpsI [Phycisphaerae bacterium]
MTALPENEPKQDAPMQDAATMGALKKRTAMLLAILAPAIALTIFLVVTEARAARVADLAEKAIPPTIINGKDVWTSTSMKFSEMEMTILETRDYVYRTYTDGRSTPVDLCVVFSEDNRKGTHPPDICLEGSGYRILSRDLRTLDAAGTKLTECEIVTTGNTTATGPGSYYYFAYFYKCGDTFTPSFYEQQMRIVWNGLTRRNAAGALIRYSTPMASLSELPAARARTDRLLGVTFPYIRDRLNVQR